jgi:hypothetical protein
MLGEGHRTVEGSVVKDTFSHTHRERERERERERKKYLFKNVYTGEKDEYVFDICN